MVEEQAEVVAISHEGTWVEAVRQSSCGSCESKKAGCGVSALGKVVGKKRVRLHVQNPVNAQVGDHVVVGIHERILLRQTGLLYLMPLLGLFIGGLAGQWLAEQWLPDQTDLGAIFFGLFGLGLAMRWMKKRHNAMENQEEMPTILRIVELHSDVNTQIVQMRNQP